MDDGIKEILDYAKEHGYIDLDYIESKALLDYITGLQEENKKLNELVQFNVETTANLTKTIHKAIEYNNHLIEHAKYHLNVNHIKKSNKILKGEN